MSDASYYSLALEPKKGIEIEEILGMIQTLKDQGVVTFYWRTGNSSIVFADAIGDANHFKIKEVLGNKAEIAALPKAQLLQSGMIRPKDPAAAADLVKRLPLAPPRSSMASCCTMFRTGWMLTALSAIWDG
jgi:predicted TIM-barrel fold metal-dependent hydrolase